MEPTLTNDEVSQLLNQIVMGIQHLELEVIWARYKLSFFLAPPHDRYLRTEILSSMGTRHVGDIVTVYDQYLSYCGLGEYDDAIDKPFHLYRKQRWRLVTMIIWISICEPKPYQRVTKSPFGAAT